MKKIENKSIWIGFVFGILFTFAGLYTAFWIDSRRTEIVEVTDVEPSIAKPIIRHYRLPGQNQENGIEKSIMRIWTLRLYRNGKPCLQKKEWRPLDVVLFLILTLIGTHTLMMNKKGCYLRMLSWNGSTWQDSLL